MMLFENASRKTLLLRPVALCAALWGVGASAGAQETPASKPEPKPDSSAAKPIKLGRDRWLVKTASDPDAAEIVTKPIKSTVEKMLALPRPVDLPLYETSPEMQARRARPVETSVWTVEADVIASQLMPDGDYRVTIRGASGQTMILEMPNPDPAFVSASSPFAARIKTARAQFDGKAKPEHASKPLALHARITGIGYFARAWNKAQPVTTNLIQLHPVLSVEWLPGPTREFIVPPVKTASPAKRN